MSPARIPVLLGTGQVGTDGNARFTDPALIQQWVDIMAKHGQVGIDTSRLYGKGTSEKLLAQLNIEGMRLDTKIFPLSPGEHEPTKLKETFKLSLEALGPNKIRVFYLHAPDRSVPFEDTLEAVNELYKQGFFGGYLTGKLLDPSAKPEPGSHFDPKWHLSSMYIGRYKATAAAVTDLNITAEKHGLKLSEVAYRWMQHHSSLGPKDHGIILGVSNVQQLEDAITDCEKGPLPEEVAAACEETWQRVKGTANPQYWV
ncbi:hypothetical protein PHLCEN_2v3043 [Hermanssonia centrifuga]|uniref:NADP-dependent oxidoreductase domain-containing protein n=1 Tax=Hermanssonia centrifuga TaxID=98765 RepID=A0A2R6R7F9_9APHY|nr:hypothetical protein PHLCEN_2v3043 [Hermanssonia centrifuga]